MGHKKASDLLLELDKLKQLTDVGDRFYHYKYPDQFYKVIAIGFIEDTETPCVVYQSEYEGNIVWVRTQDEFFTKVTLEDGTEINKFTKVI